MLTISVNEQCMAEVERLELEIKDWESKFSDNTPIMNGYYESMIAYNKAVIDRYLTNGITIKEEA